jgi:hypothetical protein
VADSSCCPFKENRRALFDALDELTWTSVPIAHRSVEKGHGRITTRTIQILPAPEDLPFPHVSQVFLIERHVTDLTGTPISAVAQLGVASPTADTATPADLARYVQGHWAIEALHWIRDTLYREDHTPRSRPDPDPASWPPCTTSRSAPTALPDAPTSPKPPAGPAAI